METPPPIQTNSSTILNKIIIPVVTTVLGATAIYFLGFNKRGGNERTDMEQLLISKEATVKAWKSYVTTTNIGYKNMKSISDEFGEKMKTAQGKDADQVAAMFTDLKDDLLRESKKSMTDVELILKEKDIDRDFISYLNRAMEYGKNDEKKSNEFFGKIAALIKSDDPDKGQKTQALLTEFNTATEKTFERSVSEAEEITKVLAEKYTSAFNLNDLLLYVDYKKQKEGKQEQPVTNQTNNPAPKEPSGPAGTEVNPNNPPADNGGSTASGTTDYTYTNTNKLQPTKALLTGNWSMTGGELELSEDGEMLWVINGLYTSGDWKLANGKLQMNATNPDNGQKFFLSGAITNFTKTSFTYTLNTTTMQGSYNFVKKRE